ncbi:hypothetical protein E2562_037745 [Oryza meyeriana var. granulata]|uniref:No apical meristem-associated C-terminal domain-containing protein n=1 Tax=Oryza meyeriana var. granulata TaxID=110450 RepID=A0A6G1FGR9_9ORYZ|nr:hypothetical protein E2562_037745 [Oryza meyeriana var. granulata]
MALRLGAQPVWWNGPLSQANSFGPASLDCGMDLRPPGGFLSFLQSGQQHVTFPPPWPLVAPATDSGTQHAKSRSKSKPVINIDDGDDVRTAKRLTWEADADLRMVSAWLFHSNDPINGNVYHCWKVLRDKPKWHAILEDLEKSNKRALDGGDTMAQEDIGEKERPMGRNEAKKQRNGKGKAKDDDDSLHEEVHGYSSCS